MNETNRWYTSLESPDAVTEELERLNDKLDRLINTVGLIDRRRVDMEEMLVDLLPAANGAMRVATDHLWELERNGILNLARETFASFETASRRVDPDDLRAIGDNAGRAVQTLRALSGPDVASASQRTVQALQSARTGKPPGFLSLLRRLRKPHVRRGVGAMLEILEGLGEGEHPTPAAAAPRRTPNHAAAAPLPSTGGAPAASPRRPASPADEAPSRPAPGRSTFSVGGRAVALDAEGFLVDGADWTPEAAEALAADVGMGPLSDEHWRVLDFCRRDAQQAGGAPGLRRITKELEIPPKDMYRLFPKGPGVLAARLAGLKKPQSCV